MTKRYTAIFAANRTKNNFVDFMELTINAVDHSDMVRQAKSLACPEGYHYIGTRDDNTWHHQPCV